MNKKIISTLLAVLLLFVAFAACAPSENTESPVGNASAESSVVQESSTQTTGTSSKIVIHGSASHGIDLLDSMIERSSIIVRGKIARQVKTAEVTHHVIDGVTNKGVRTYYEIEVSELFAGDKMHAERTEVWLTGGETENMIHIVDGQYIPEIGEEHFYFIAENGGFYKQAFPVLDGDQVLVFNGEMPELFEDETNYLQATTIPADEFAEILRDKIAEVNAQKKQ